MPKRTDIKKILLIGSGPIVIGQACEFDYSGTQACKALREEGYEVVLINSNPATIMTDPEFADQTYIEPLTWEFVASVIEKERPCAVLPTLGGQTALNIAIKLYENGILQKFNVEMIGANYDVIKKAEDRELFKKAILKIGLDVPNSAFAYTLDEAREAAQKIGFPLIIRPSFTLGGTGGGFANTMEELEAVASRGLESSMIHEILIEESIYGWKEYELEVMRDTRDNVVIVCSIENLDPMGVHTGDSITVAPSQTLTDREYQAMRNAALAIIREIGVETGGSNIQFAVNPETGRMIVIEMNPRVSRSSALASKATGFPIAKFAAKLAVGYSLDEIQNDITKVTPASFEPSIDYCVIKIPRFTFEKFPEAKDVLGVQMKSVGETMAIGRTFKEALQKGLGGLEIGHTGFDNKIDYRTIPDEKVRQRLIEPNASRIFYVKYAMQKGWSLETIFDLTKIDMWFLAHMKTLVDFEGELTKELPVLLSSSNVLIEDPVGKPGQKTLGSRFRGNDKFAELIRQAKEWGFSDRQLARILNITEVEFRNLRKSQGISAVFKVVDTCAAEFEAYTPYFYSTYEMEDEAADQIKAQHKARGAKKKIMILGGGPNRIGQGIEFDYCCCHASFALKDMGFETIMVNSNPETVSTDYDISDRLYFEPLTFEHVMNIVDVEKPDGVIVQFGGQTPLNLAKSLHDAGVPIIGTSVASIDVAEDRKKFAKLMNELGLSQPENGSGITKDEVVSIADKIGYPVLVRPSYVLGGRAMKIVYNREKLAGLLDELQEVSQGHPILVDRFLESAIEVDVDALSDGEDVFVAGIMEHIESAGIHSGDSACVLPPITLDKALIEDIKNQTCKIAKALKVIGLLNIQFAIREKKIFILEVNPRASRTSPFVSKATGMPLAKIAAKIMAGAKLKSFNLRYEDLAQLKHISVKESVLPFSKFSGVDIVLGPEMKSTGEVMGTGATFGEAFAKSQISAYQALPQSGTIFISVKNEDKKAVVGIAQRLSDMGFKLIATDGTAKALEAAGISVETINKYDQGEHQSLIQKIKDRRIVLIINTPSGEGSQSDMRAIRSASSLHSVPCITTLQGAQAAVNGIESLKTKAFTVNSLQELYAKRGAACAA